MDGYVKRAIFVYDKESEYICESMQDNPFETEVTCVEIDGLEELLQTREKKVRHVVVSGSIELIKKVFGLAKTAGFSIGIVALPSQRDLISCYDLSPTVSAGIDLALQEGVAQPFDLVFCNDKMLLFKATVGRLPLLEAVGDTSRLQLLKNGVRKLSGLRLLPFNFTTGSGKKVDTCASGCMIIQHHHGTRAATVINTDSSSVDGKVSLLISAPFSIYSYLQFIFSCLGFSRRKRKLSHTVGYIKSPEITINSGVELDVVVDGEGVTKTPVSCRVEKQAVRINLGINAREEVSGQSGTEEKIEIDNLPRGKEVVKLQQKHLPFFSVASEDRFKTLFIALRSDAKIDTSYIVLMLLSTLLATIGVYLNSSAVVIGAMLLAPLMAPIVSLAMGLLRYDDELTINSMKKIGLGVLLALSASALLVLFFSYKPLTSEMQGRLNPTLLDLGVAVIAGVAAAYTKSFQEIMQGLAGVAIAVALVPPLAVAGIGLGRGDVYFFSHAFLLFITNLFGIVFASIFTFLVLGFSPAVKARRSVLAVLLALALITVPLYYSYNKILNKYHAEKRWQVERFLVNGKYIIIRNIRLSTQEDVDVIFMDILARESLSRKDLNQLKMKIRSNFPNRIVIRAKIEYIL